MKILLLLWNKCIYLSIKEQQFFYIRLWNIFFLAFYRKKFLRSIFLNTFVKFILIINNIDSIQLDHWNILKGVIIIVNSKNNIVHFINETFHLIMLQMKICIYDTEI